MVYHKILTSGNITFWNIKKMKDRQGEGKDETKWKNMTKGGKNMPTSFALYGDDPGKWFEWQLC